jgi:hypothetical protein
VNGLAFRESGVRTRLAGNAAHDNAASIAFAERVASPFQEALKPLQRYKARFRAQSRALSRMAARARIRPCDLAKRTGSSERVLRSANGAKGESPAQRAG